MEPPTSRHSGAATQTPDRRDTRGSARIRTLAVCFIAENMCGGFAFGSFGPLLPSTEAHFEISRTAAASGMSVLMLVLGLLSPFIGSALGRTTVRRAMIAGALVSALGYTGLALSSGYAGALLAYGLIGAGVSVTGILGPLALVSQWFERDRAKALSFVNLPVMLLVSPYLVATLLPELGRTVLLMGIAVAFVVLVPLLLLIAIPPPAQGTAVPSAPLAAGGSLLRGLPIWLLSIGTGVIAGAGSAYYVHIVPFGIERAMTLPMASALVSIYAGSGIIGTLLFGWLADRIGPVRALMLSAALQAFLWWGIVQGSGNALYVIAGLLGICAVPQNTLLGAANSALFGSQGVRAMGICYALKLPFLFGFAPLMAIFFEMSGGYELPFLICAALLLAATATFAVLQSITSNSRRAETADPGP